LGGSVWDPLPVLCGQTSCDAFRDGRPLFFDGDHLSADGNRALYPSFLAFVENLDAKKASARAP
jgi:lysophospholipase L1-like esterase